MRVRYPKMVAQEIFAPTNQIRAVTYWRETYGGDLPICFLRTSLPERNVTISLILI